MPFLKTIYKDLTRKNILLIHLNSIEHIDLRNRLDYLVHLQRIPAIEKPLGAFRIADIQRECPGVSVDMIRQVLKKLREDRRIECLGRGQNAQWQRKTK